MIALIVEYVLGMYTALFSAAPDDPQYLTEPVINKIIFGLHGLVGLFLLIGATVMLIMGLKSNNPTKHMAIHGFLSIFLAFGAGIATVMLKETASEIASFIMSVGFLLSFIIYGKLFFLLKKEK